MELESPGEITKILSAATGGDRSAVDQLYVILYPELRALAHRQVRRVDGSDIVDTTSLVNESYLRFVNAGRLSVSDRRQFLAYAAHVMRSVVVDFVRRARAQRRGGRNVHVSLDTNLLGSLESPADEIIRINELLRTPIVSAANHRRALDITARSSAALQTVPVMTAARR
jgi:RNA polymerase sigma factor (TIGR02999 family)